MKNLFDKVTSYLINKYECHTIILYGSYAEGDYTPESDLDILCFSDRETELNDTVFFDGIQLDAWVTNTARLEKPGEYLHILNNKVLLDSRGAAVNFISAINDLFKKGKEPISDNQKDFLKSWLGKMQKRSLRGDAEGLYRYHWMLKDSLEIYFELNNLWFLGVKKSLKWLENNKPEVFKMFADALRGKPGCEESRILINYIIEN